VKKLGVRRQGTGRCCGKGGEHRPAGEKKGSAVGEEGAEVVKTEISGTEARALTRDRHRPIDFVEWDDPASKRYILF
jgi:hypothetical protein